MSVRNAVIAIIGNKSDSDTPFESEISNMTINVREFHQTMRVECGSKNCRHLIFGRISALTGMNLDPIMTNLGQNIITIAVKDIQVEQLRQDVRRIDDKFKSSQLNSFDNSFTNRKNRCRC